MFFSLRYPARNSHASYCHMSPASLYNLIPHIPYTVRFKKKLWIMKCVPQVSIKLFSEIFFILRRTEWDIKINISLHVKYPLFLSDSNETVILSTNFRKRSNVKFHGNSSSQAELFHANGRTWRSQNSPLEILRTRIINSSPLRVRTFCTISRYVSSCFTLTPRRKAQPLAGCHACSLVCSR
jgi:hypothetical protein